MREVVAAQLDEVAGARIVARRVEAAPELVSVQFVPYSFHPAGLSFALPQVLRAIFGQTPVQIMFHELWIGTEIGSRFKTRMVGFCQRKIIETVVNKLACRVIHTSNLVYTQLLSRYGITAKHLPLFGSFPGRGLSLRSRNRCAAF